MPLTETSKNKPRKAVTTRKPYIDMEEEEEEGGGGGSTMVDETMDDDAHDHDESNSYDQQQKKHNGDSDIEDDADADEDDEDDGPIEEAAEPVEHDDDDDNDDDEGAEEEDPDSNQSSEQEEQVEPPAFSLATLGLQRVGSAPPPKPKGQKAPIPTLNARGMPARIRKKNPLFYDENIINDDKPLRMSLAPKKAGPGRPPNSAGGNAAAKAAVGAIPSKVLKKRKGVVSRYMRNSDNGSSSNSASSQQGIGAGAGGGVGKLKKTPVKLQAKSTGGAAGRAQSSMHGKTGKGGMRSIEGGGKGQSAFAAAMATAQEDASKAEAVAATNKRLGQSIGLRLRNLLKLPKAHKWAIAEWFYSYIDKPLFDCKDEFMNHVSELAPRLGTRKLNRHEWVNIRRRMGKPRRCSANFFSEERKELDRKRQMMRTLQSRKPGELKEPGLLSDMPEKIPMPLPLGTKVTARLRAPQDGIFAGTVAAYDSLNAMYRVTFERPGLGTHSIPDYEIVSENFHEMLPLQSFTKDFRPNLVSIYHPSCLGFTTNLGFTANLTNSYSQKRLTPSANGGISGGAGGNPGMQSTPQKHLATNNAAARNALSMKLNKSDPLLGQDAVGESPGRLQLTRHHGYPMKLLEHLLHLENYISCKNSKIQRLNKMNTTAELTMGEMVGQDESGDRQRKLVRDEFQRRYASNIISIERINSELMYELTKVQELSSSLSRNPNVQAMISPTYLREECRTKASDTVDDLNKGLVKSARMIKLLKNLTTLLIVTQNLGGECESNEVNKVLEGCIEEVRSNLVCSDNIVVFQKSVQLRLEYIAMDITRCLEEQSLNRNIEDGVKSPKSEALEECMEQVVADDVDDAQDQQKRKKGIKQESSSHKDEHDIAYHMDVDTIEHEIESEEEKKHEAREPREPPQPATIDDTQITIESVKESEEDDDTEEDQQSPHQKQKQNVKEFHSQMDVLEDDDDEEIGDGEEEFILEDEN